MVEPVVRMDYEYSLITDDDLFLFNEGSHFRLYEKLGAHPVGVAGESGVYFAVWAPNADQVLVVGDFNQWDGARHPLRSRKSSGIWEGCLIGVGKGARYKFRIKTKYFGYVVDKADPFAVFSQVPPATASVVWDLDYAWQDQAWMAERQGCNARNAPMSIYEVHPGSWQRVPEENHRPLTYRELAPRLADHVARTGFTHVEFLPVMEHPFYGSWGYQITGFFAPTSRYGTPQDFMYLVDCLHRNGIGVILDWVPSHFPNDEHGLAFFDGTHLFEHADPRQGIHPDWDTSIFNYGRNEVRSFLISNGLYWLDKYHIDGLRMDAVASMLYLDYSRGAGEWIPNQHGGRENLEAVDFIRRFNQEAYKAHPDIQTIAEESTAWPMATKPPYIGGLGFGYKWDMGWMHDTLEYISLDPVHRKFHHNELTFRSLYTFSENFVMPLSHDEVVHGKSSLLAKMPGDDWQKFANLRLLLGYMYAQPGKKLLFMGAEIGQWREWDHNRSLDWSLLEHDRHRGLLRWVEDINRVYRNEAAMHLDCDPAGFEWIDGGDADNSVICFLRKSANPGEEILIVCNFTPVPRTGYRVGVPESGYWKELLNSDAEVYWGSGMGNSGGVWADAVPFRDRPCSLGLLLPPLAVCFFQKRR
ncbi:MAG TPA: 1,4-alpha-glucan branching protein GlgB [Acidobacteriota bacterium]|nr:1,4-alpha-glucan branching protein GlgB [Acidobacteriota bacterium]